jgi:RNA polymerase sigma factor (sigma-70 family)
MLCLAPSTTRFETTTRPGGALGRDHAAPAVARRDKIRRRRRRWSGRWNGWCADVHPLLERAGEGDRAARAELVEQHSAELRRYVDRKMGSQLRRHVTADDICQDALMQAFGAIPALRAEATLDDFRRVLLKNAHWILLDRGRGGRRFAGESAAPASLGALGASGAHSRSGAVTRGDDLRLVNALIERLGPKYGAVVSGRLAGKEFAEIAAELGETEMNVRKRHQRAVAMLKERVEAAEAARRGATESPSKASNGRHGNADHRT